MLSTANNTPTTTTNQTTVCRVVQRQASNTGHKQSPNYTAMDKPTYEEPTHPEVPPLCRTLKVLTLLRKVVLSQDISRNTARSLATRTGQTPQGPPSRRPNLSV